MQVAYQFEAIPLALVANSASKKGRYGNHAKMNSALYSPNSSTDGIRRLPHSDLCL